MDVRSSCSCFARSSNGLFCAQKRRRAMIRPNNVRFLERGERLEGHVSAVVSLHCHTLHSKEILDFVPYYAERIPLISLLWHREQRRSIRQHGKPPDFDKGYWTPPLTGRQVFEMESASMSAL